MSRTRWIETRDARVSVEVDFAPDNVHPITLDYTHGEYPLELSIMDVDAIATALSAAAADARSARGE